MIRELIETCLNGNSIELSLNSFIDSSINEKYDIPNLLFYFWININDYGLSLYRITFLCRGTTINEGSVQFNAGVGLHQFYLKYSDSTFSKSDGSETFSCPSMEITISSNNDIFLSKMKITTSIKDYPFPSSCTQSDVKCPYSYYCNINLDKCIKCSGINRECEGETICGRFTEQWYIDSPQSFCTPQYFNLQKFEEMSFDITPPIKSSASSLSFWFFTLVDENGKNIYHITLEDFFVVTIIPGESS